MYSGACTLSLVSLVLAEGDPGNGENVFRNCKAWHALGEGAKDKAGPVLNGVHGGEADLPAEFGYSNVMQVSVLK